MCTAATSFTFDSDAQAAPWLDSVGKLLFVMARSAKTTVRATLSTSVRTVAKTALKMRAGAPAGLIDTAARIWLRLPSQA